MRIIIVGAGALGLLYAARLALAGEDVVLLARTEEQAEALSTDGIRYKEATGRELVIQISAWSMSAFMKAGQAHAFVPDWVMLAVKQPSVNEELLDDLKLLLAGGVPLLALQNGIGHMELLGEALPHSPLYAAVTTEGALRNDSTTVVHTGIGQLTFGYWTEPLEYEPNSQKMLLAALNGAGIGANLSNDMKNPIYLKLLINAVINPLTAIFQIKNGELPHDPYRLKLMRTLHDESAAILQAGGLRSSEDLWERLLGVCEATYLNESSMLRDVRAGRVTEIQWINGGMVRLAGRLGLKSPMNEAVLALVGALHHS